MLECSAVTNKPCSAPATWRVRGRDHTWHACVEHRLLCVDQLLVAEANIPDGWVSVQLVDPENPPRELEPGYVTYIWS